MSANLEFISHRSPVMSTGGMVAANQPLAVAAGLLVLEQGGNAVDAAVAAAAALAVTEPCSTGLGGDCFALVYRAAERQVYALNGSGRAPAALTLERLQREGFGEHLPPTHAHTVTTPGACAAWCDLVKRFGALPLATSLAPAVRLAEEGFPVSPLTSHFWRRGAERQLSRGPNGRSLMIDGRGPLPGEIFYNLALGRVLREVASGGAAAFYQGGIAEAVVQAVREEGGCLALEDLAEHTSTWVEPISTVFEGVRVWECPPNGQGLVALQALNILRGFDLASLPALSAARLHLIIEALRLVFADARRYVADPALEPAPLEDLLSEAYAAQRRQSIRPWQANPDPRFGVPNNSSDTVYLSVVDEAGNACSLINSNFMGFGTGIVPAGCGFSLQNRGANFSLDPTSPNRVAPRKRPYHTIIPAMATHEADGQLYASLGVMGGFMQPQGHVQVLLGLLIDQLDPQAALDRPRVCLDAEQDLVSVALEDGIPAAVLGQLAAMGHRVRQVSGLERSLFGRGQIIQRRVFSPQQPAVLLGGSDPRGDGCVMSLG